MDIMNINTFSLGGFGGLFAVQYYKIDIGKERMYGKLIDKLLIKQKNFRGSTFLQEDQRRKSERYASKLNFRERALI